MRFSGKFLYRVRIVKYPPGALTYIGDGCWVPTDRWSPPGWKPEGRYIDLVGTSEFRWPTSANVYASRSSAKKRANLIESFGATAVVERSAQIYWPAAEGGDYSESAEEFLANEIDGIFVDVDDPDPPIGGKDTDFAGLRNRLLEARYRMGNS